MKELHKYFNPLESSFISEKNNWEATQIGRIIDSHVIDHFPELRFAQIAIFNVSKPLSTSNLVKHIALMLLAMVALRHPYIGRRLLIMVPTLIIISLVTFFIIQLPPGDFLSVRIMQLQLEGNEQALEEIAELEKLFSMRDPVATQYARWLGLPWFVSFDEKDEGLLQGHMGRSMEDRRAVNDIVGDRVLLTFLISLGTSPYVFCFR